MENWRRRSASTPTSLFPFVTIDDLRLLRAATGSPATRRYCNHLLILRSGRLSRRMVAARIVPTNANTLLGDGRDVNGEGDESMPMPCTQTNIPTGSAGGTSTAPAM